MRYADTKRRLTALEGQLRPVVTVDLCDEGLTLEEEERRIAEAAAQVGSGGLVVVWREERPL
jgi:hypothetical protein